MIGFALAAPVIALLLAAFVALAGSMWQREVASSLLNQSVERAASLGGSMSAERGAFEAATQDAGLHTKEFEWRTVSANGFTVIEARVTLSVGGGMLPEFDVRLQSSSPAK